MYRQTMNTRASFAQRYPVLTTIATVAGLSVCVFGFVALLIDQLCK